MCDTFSLEKETKTCMLSLGQGASSVENNSSMSPTGRIFKLTRYRFINSKQCSRLGPMLGMTSVKKTWLIYEIFKFKFQYEYDRGP